jgi:hypothetical protein
MPYPQSRLESDSDLAPLVADFYRDASPPVRYRLLKAMLRPVGPLALAALAAGAFARFLPDRPHKPAQLQADGVAAIEAAQVFELAHYVEQKAPELLADLPNLLGDDAVWQTTASGPLLARALAAMRRAP